MLFTVIMSVVLAGCATPIQHNTPSGKVEVTIKGTSKSTVKDRITDSMINRGYSVTKSDDTVISFDRPVDSPMAAVFFGSRYDSTPNARVAYNIIQTKGAVRVVADCSIVTNPGSAFEKKTNMNNNAATADIQSWLNEIKINLEK
ncbi:MAG: hypothetical protein ACK4NR_09325 [Micavibrio sp.]